MRGRRPLTPNRPPFWNVLRGEGRPAAGAPRAVLLDVHGAVRTDDPGVAVVSGWGLRGAAPHETESSPPGELDRVIEKHGRYATNLNRDVTGRPLLERSQLRTLERMTARRVDILLDLMDRHPWEVCSTIFFETHYAGHTFHQYARRDAYIEPVPRGRGIEDGLLRVYKAADSRNRQVDRRGTPRYPRGGVLGHGHAAQHQRGHAAAARARGAGLHRARHRIAHVAPAGADAAGGADRRAAPAGASGAPALHRLRRGGPPRRAALVRVDRLAQHTRLGGGRAGFGLHPPERRRPRAGGDRPVAARTTTGSVPRSRPTSSSCAKPTPAGRRSRRWSTARR